MRPAQLLTVLEREFQAALHGQHTPVMLWGAPGVGKSQMVAQVAERHGMPVIDLRLSQMEPSDLRGIPFRNDGRVDWAVPSMLPEAERHGNQGILFLDEITSVPPSVSAAAYQLILDRRLGAYEVPDGWAIFAAGNRQGDRGVTYTMPAPLANRFSHFDVDINLDDLNLTVPPEPADHRVVARRVREPARRGRHVPGEPRIYIVTAVTCVVVFIIVHVRHVRRAPGLLVSQIVRHGIGIAAADGVWSVFNMSNVQLVVPEDHGPGRAHGVRVTDIGG